jgi:hypothetical protein
MSFSGAPTTTSANVLAQAALWAVREGLVDAER